MLQAMSVEERILKIINPKGMYCQKGNVALIIANIMKNEIYEIHFDLRKSLFKNNCLLRSSSIDRAAIKIKAIHACPILPLFIEDKVITANVTLSAIPRNKNVVHTSIVRLYR